MGTRGVDPERQCAECGRTGASYYKRGWCPSCYRRWQRHGTPSAGRTRVTDPVTRVRNLAFQRPTDACIEWPWNRTDSGYGKVAFQGRSARVTHVVLLLDGRPWHPPLGYHALHSCDNPPCVNPRHLRWGTNAANVQDAVERSQMNQGTRNGNALLTDDVVRHIRDLRKNGVTLRELAELAGVSPATVGDAARGKSWRHV